MDGIFGAFSLVFLGCGIYGFYAWIKMKKDGHINETLLLGKNLRESNCKDKEAFLKRAMPAALIFSVGTTAYGVIDLIHYFVMPIKALDTAAMIIFLVVLIWFMVYTTKLKNKYF